jgi:hypothetical protein
LPASATSGTFSTQARTGYVNRFQVESSEDPPIHIHKIRADEANAGRGAQSDAQGPALVVS